MDKVRQENLPKVSVIIPMRNEEKYIDKCLRSIIDQDYPKEKTEILVVDGMSEDNSVKIVLSFVKKYPFIKLSHNPKIIQTFATNIGLKNAKGDVIIRMDAHAEYPKDYVSRSIYWLKKSGADCVGGILITKPGDNTLIAKAISLVLSHPFGVGNAYFRTGLQEPKHVDTVPFGCYKKEVFDKIGIFNEKLDRTDDIEFNLRLRRAGGKILLIPEIKSYYYARSNLIPLAEQNFGNGFWIIYSTKFAEMPFSLRHLVPFVFISSLLSTFFLSPLYKLFFYIFLAILGVYLIINSFFSFAISLRQNLKLLPLVMVSLFTLHFSYSLGSIWGFVNCFYFMGKRSLVINNRSI